MIGKGGTLLVSIHDVGPAFEGEVDRLHALLTKHVPENRIAMLVVPDHWGKAPLAGNAGFATRLRDWSDAGIEMFVHGWYHRDTAEHSGLASFKAKHMTASEGEFLGLDEATATQRMQDGKALIEDIIGRETAGFVAPAWLYGKGAMAALRTSGFRLAEDHMRVWRPATGEVLAKGPVVTWASRSPWRIRSSLAVAKAARAGLFFQKTLRVAVHPGDTTVPALVDSIDRTLGKLAATRMPIRYRDLGAHSEHLVAPEGCENRRGAYMGAGAGPAREREADPGHGQTISDENAARLRDAAADRPQSAAMYG